MTFLRVNNERKAVFALNFTLSECDFSHSTAFPQPSLVGEGSWGIRRGQPQKPRWEIWFLWGQWLLNVFLFFPICFQYRSNFTTKNRRKKKKSLYESDKKSSVFFLHYTIFLTSPFHPTLNTININKEHVNCKADFHHVSKSHLPSNTGPFANGSNLAQRTILKVTRII